MIILTLVEIQIIFPEKLKPSDVPKLRGFFGRKFIDQPIFHHHQSNGGYIYSYPLVQYKIIGGEAYLMGIGVGGEALLSVWNKINVVEFENARLPIWESRIRKYKVDFGDVEQEINYKFITPWLALNQKNIGSYLKCNDWKSRKAILRSVLIGNILSMAKGLGYTIKHQLNSTLHLKERKCVLKGNPMIGFIGTFSVNFSLPDHVGIGKSVARGFGTISRKIKRV